MAEKPKSSPIANILSLIVVGVVLYACFGGSEKEKTPQQAADDSALAAENKRKGFHCLSAWDGSHRDFTRAVKEQMRDPDSFEHIETRVTPIDSEGDHTILLQYRSRNGFGGMNVGNAFGTFKNSDCSFKILSLE